MRNAFLKQFDSILSLTILDWYKQQCVCKQATKRIFKKNGVVSGSSDCVNSNANANVNRIDPDYIITHIERNASDLL